ncbi:MAG: Crp/Fnr family transcriptional regulator [Proteobacteria bacterium]|nr:Crp/Fnr family transcriptional regulator [Pseudomonadota bacterium]
MNGKFLVLQRNPWFARQPPRLRDALLERSRVSRIETGRWIYGTGDALNGLYGVLEGSVQLLMTPGDGEPRLLDIAPAGQLFGQAAHFGGGPRLVTAIAGEPTLLLHVPDYALAEVARSEPTIWRNFTALLYAQLAGALQLVTLLIHLPPPERIAARLALLTLTSDTISLTQSQLAELCGLSRKTVNGHLRKLAREKIIAVNYHSVTVLHREKLHARAGGILRAML